MTLTPRCLAWAMTESSAVASAGLRMIAFAPEEIRLRIAAICSGAAPFWLEMRTLLTLPLAAACALTAQIISSRQPLPTSVLETPRTYFLPELPPLDPLLELELSVPLPHAATTTAATSATATAMPVRALMLFLLLEGLSPDHRRVQLDVLPPPAAHRAIAGVEDDVDDVAVHERLTRLRTGTKALDEVAQLLVVAVVARFVGDR